MNRFLRAVAVALCAAGTASAFAACGGNDRPGPVTPPPQEEEKPAKKAYDILSDDYTVLNGGTDDADGLTLNSAVLELDKAVLSVKMRNGAFLSAECLCPTARAAGSF